MFKRIADINRRVKAFVVPSYVTANEYRTDLLLDYLQYCQKQPRGMWKEKVATHTLINWYMIKSIVKE